MTGSKAKGEAIGRLLAEQRKSIASEASRRLKGKAQGPSLTGPDMTLVVCSPPGDLPEKYKENLTDETRILVDGYQRYKAIKDSLGIEARISVKTIEVDSVSQVMREALELNYRNSMPLSRGEKLANVFRLLLLGEFNDGFPWRPQFGDIASPSTLSEYKRLADFSRRELNLEGLSFEQLRIALIQGIKDVLGEFEAIHYDDKGFPSKRSVSMWAQVVQKGSIEEWRNEKLREAAYVDEEKQEASRSLSKALERYSPETQVATLQRQLAMAKAELADKPDDDFKALFVDEPGDFDLTSDDEEF